MCNQYFGVAMTKKWGISHFYERSIYFLVGYLN